MRGLNKVQILGHLGRDPEMKYTPSGKAVTTFSVAVNRPTRTAGGERGEEVEWIRCVAWEGLAETANQYLRKGSKVYGEGRLQTRSWKDEASGQPRALTEVVVGELILLDPRPGSAGAPAATGAADPDDLPF
jgi:single-strand DNA-binding protein